MDKLVKNLPLVGAKMLAIIKINIYFDLKRFKGTYIRTRLHKKITLENMLINVPVNGFE